MASILEKAGDILYEKQNNLTAGDIRKGKTIFGITGTFEGGQDTSDATATSNDIENGKTAYANNEKITGSLPIVSTQTTIAGGQIDIDDNNETVTFNGAIDSKAIYGIGATVKTYKSYSDVAQSIGLSANKIKMGETILGIEGNYAGSVTNVIDVQGGSVGVNNNELQFNTKEYTRLEYLQSTGTQYIELPFPTLQTTISDGLYDIEMDMQFTRVRSDSYYYDVHGISASYSSSDSDYLYVGIYHKSSNTPVWVFSNGTTSDFITSTASNLNRHTFKVISSMDSSTKGLYVDGTRVDSSGPTGSTACNYYYPFMLFGYRRPNGPICTRCKLYSVKIGKPLSNLLYNLVPAKYGNEYCMYDLVHNKPYFNSGTGTFIAGPEVVE